VGVVRALLAELRAVGAWGWGRAGSRAGSRAGGKAGGKAGGGCTFPNQTPHSCSVPCQVSPRMIRSCAASSAESLAAAPPPAAALVVAPLLLLRMGVGAPGPEFSCRLSVRCTSVCYPKPKRPRLFALPSKRKRLTRSLAVRIPWLLWDYYALLWADGIRFEDCRPSYVVSQRPPAAERCPATP
jgi:hypothetical protein